MLTGTDRLTDRQTDGERGTQHAAPGQRGGWRERYPVNRPPDTQQRAAIQRHKQAKCALSVGCYDNDDGDDDDYAAGG